MKFRNLILDLHPNDINRLINLIKKYNKKIVDYLRKITREDKILTNLKFNDLIINYYLGSDNKSYSLNWLVEKFENLYSIFKGNVKPISYQIKQENFFLKCEQIQLPDFIQDRTIKSKDQNIENACDSKVINQSTRIDFSSKKWAEDHVVGITTDVNKSSQTFLKNRTGNSPTDKSLKSSANFNSEDIEDEISLYSSSGSEIKNTDLFNTDFLCNYKQKLTIFKDSEFKFSNNLINRKRDMKITSDYTFSSSLYDIY